MQWQATGILFAQLVLPTESIRDDLGARQLMEECPE